MLPFFVNNSMTIIYKATNKLNKKAYIGITNNLDQRKISHRHGDSYFHLALEAFGYDGFEWETLEKHKNRKDAVKREIELIKRHKTHRSENGYNVQLSENNGGGKPKDPIKKFDELNSLLKVINYYGY